MPVMLSRARPLALAALVLATGGARPRPAHAPVGAEIIWDSYGVPHIYARDRHALAFALGWAQMRNHGDLALRLAAQARGRAAELLGPGYLDDDRWVWTLGLPDASARWLAVQRPAMRAHLAAFVQGMNAFARAHPDLVGDSVRAVLPLHETDVIGNLLRLEYDAYLVTGREIVGQETRRWESIGSNAWAIAPSRTADHHTMLLANPHLPWSDIYTWLEVQYAMPGVNVSGAALVLAPVIQIGFNDDLGWTHTVNTQDPVDLYELDLAGDGYRYDGRVRPFETSVRVLRVRQPDGSLRDDTLRLRRSIYGPVVRAKPGKAIALRGLGLQAVPTPYAFDQWWAMGNAHTLAQFLAAIRPNQLTGYNVTYADRAGHVMMFYGGNTPVRRDGDRAYWEGIVRGDTSATLWTSRIPFDDMPRVLDPPSGWVQNTNDPPWLATVPRALDPAKYPPYLAPMEMPLRSQRSVQLLEGVASLTYDELIAEKHSTRMLLADRVLDTLVAAARASGTAVVHRAADVLAHWDRTADAGSRGAVLFVVWWREYTARRGGRTPWAQPWRADAPLTTPSGVADPALAVAALGSAADTVVARYGRLDVPWGDVFRLRRDTFDLPSNGASGALGVFRVQNYVEMPDHRWAAGLGGDSYVAAVEFTTPLRAMTIVGYGNASRTGSRHRTDQLSLYAGKALKPAWRSRKEAMANAELIERL